MVNIIQDFIPAGRKNRPGRANPDIYITIHNTANTSKGAGAKSHAAYLKSDAAASIPASYHYTVDDKEIYQHLPDTEDAYHAGDGSGDGNRKSIGIEICENSDGDILKATDNAAQLTAMLCKKYNIPITNVIQHNNWSGKDCPSQIRAGKPYNWNMFLNNVRGYLKEGDMTEAEIRKIVQDEIKAALKGEGTGLSVWAKDDAANMIRLGITDGTRPAGAVTREEAWVMLGRLLKYINGGH